MQSLATKHGWHIAADGPTWRRVVASPEPLRIVEQPSIAMLVNAGVIVICAGGGGAPVVEEANGQLRGVEAVVDKDLTAMTLALALAADGLLLLTDVSAVMRDFGGSDPKPIRRLALDEVAGLSLPAGSMGPKVAACVRFTAASGRPSAIGALSDAVAILAGDAGTTIVPTTQRSLMAVGGVRPS